MVKILSAYKICNSLLHGTEYNVRYNYFPSYDIFVSLFSEPSGKENINKNIRTRKIYPYCTSNMR